MASAGPEPGFSLSYELQPGDLTELAAESPRNRRRRARVVAGLVAWVALGVAFLGFTVVLGRSSAASDSRAIRALLLGVSGTSWAGAVVWARMLWRLRPEQVARRIWRASPQLHGRHRDQVDSVGVIWTAADGVQTIIPWSKLVAVHETGHAFNLLDAGGAVLVALPKRGLPSPDLIPPLRDYLSRSVGGKAPTGVTADVPGEPKP